MCLRASLTLLLPLTNQYALEDLDLSLLSISLLMPSSLVRLLFLQLFPLALPTIDAEALLRKRRDSQTSRERISGSDETNNKQVASIWMPARSVAPATTAATATAAPSISTKTR